VTPDRSSTSEGYWYDTSTSTETSSSIELLTAVRRFRRAHEAMRRRMSIDMGVSTLDLRALQLVVASERRGVPISPHELGTELNVSSGAMTKLVDRLIRSDHLSRAPHPRDRRSVRLVATPHAHEELRTRMSDMHERMARAAATVPAEARAAVTSFLDELSQILDDEAAPSPRT
jgi:DNA-binding MarR family transcriptional regulator